MSLSKKSMSIQPSSTLAISSKAKAMKADGLDVISFGAGEPDFDTPENIKRAAIIAIENGFTKYTPASGIPDLKKAICEKFKKENGISYTPANIVVSNGAKHSLLNAFQAICNPGDEVIIPGPYWVSYPEMVKMADGVPVELIAKEENGFEFTIDELKAKITNKTKALVLNSPSNPTGMVYDNDLIKEIADLCVEKGIYVVADEIYERLVYDREATVSIASLNDEIKDLTIIVNGVSKTYSMTGWRIGYTAANEKITKIMSNMQSHATSNPNSIAQMAAIEAITGPQDAVATMKKAFNERRKYMFERINSIQGLSCIMPGGAFYIMMNISAYKGKELYGKMIDGSDSFAGLLLEKNLTAVVPGSGFGTDDHVRLSYATSMQNIEKGLDRIEEFVLGKL
jgi:aspartate aminotransferase